MELTGHDAHTGQIPSHFASGPLESALRDLPCQRDRLCEGLVPKSGPSLGSNDRVPGPDSPSHVLQHSGVGTISCAWQHLNPFGRAVLHLELEPKPPYHASLSSPSNIG